MSWSGVDSVRMRRDEAEEVWEELNGPRKKTEIDVIKDWLVHIFQPFEKTADMVVTDFKFEQFGGNSGKKEAQQGMTNGKNNGSAGASQQEGGGKGANNHWVTRFGIRSPLQGSRDGDVDDEEEEDDEWEDTTFRVLKRADVKLKVAGKEKEYSVVIKVIPTDDPERHTDQKKFSAVLKFAKEVQVRSFASAFLLLLLLLLLILLQLLLLPLSLLLL